MRFRLGRRKHRFYAWSIGTNLAATRSMLAPVTRPTDLILPDDLSKLPNHLHAPGRHRACIRAHSHPHMTLLALDHNGDDDDHSGGDEERRAWPMRAEETTGSGRRMRFVEVDVRRYRARRSSRLGGFWATSRSPSPDAPTSTCICGDHARSSTPTAARDATADSARFKNIFVDAFPHADDGGATSRAFGEGKRNHRAPLNIGGAPDLGEKGWGRGYSRLAEREGASGVRDERRRFGSTWLEWGGG
ncbi:hypothetical protein EV122DRAFT_248759 [Schizophyllum commune]